MLTLRKGINKISAMSDAEVTAELMKGFNSMPYKKKELFIKKHSPVGQRKLLLSRIAR